MAAAAQAQTAATATDPVQLWLARRSACPQLDADKIGSPAPSLAATYSEKRRERMRHKCTSNRTCEREY